MKQISEQFNRAAASYQQAALLQQEVGIRLDERLDYINMQPKNIIDLGCGTGALLSKLSARYPDAKITGVDFAEKMLHQAAMNFSQPLICAEAKHLPFADNSVDLIISNLMFQWCDPLINVFKECYRVLRDGGLLMFTSFGPDTLQELRYSWALVDDLPHVHEFVDMHHVGDWLMQSHFNDPVMDMEYINMTYADVISVMRDLQNIGATNQNPQRRKSLTGKNKLLQMMQHYQQFVNHENRFIATYEIVYGHAWKLPRPTPANEVYISLDQIKKN